MLYCPVCPRCFTYSHCLARHVERNHQRYHRNQQWRCEENLSSQFQSLGWNGNYSSQRSSYADPASVDLPSNPESNHDDSPNLDSDLDDSRSQPDQCREELFPDAEARLHYVASRSESTAEKYIHNPIYPFNSDEEYNFAKLATKSG